MYGFIDVLKSIIGPLLEPSVSNFLFDVIFKTGLTIAYIITAIFLWTGKDMTSGT